ncbi:MAG: hypothetical protein WAK18_11840 [Nocardioidaceae bacterium]
MSELLKDVMNDRAVAAGGPHLDLDAIVSNGNKRIRRNRVMVGVVATAAVIAAVFAVPAVVDRDSLGQRNLQPATTKPAFATRTTSWAVDTTIYYGDDAIDVSPHTVTSLVQTDYGFVFTAVQGDHSGVYWTDAVTTKRIGETNQVAGTILAADDSGPYVEWVDTDAKPLPEFVVFDTSTGKEVARTSEGNIIPPDQTDEFVLPVVHAIDGETAYWHSSAGTVAYDLRSGNQQVVMPGTGPSYLFDVANGLFGHASFDDQASAVTTTMSGRKPIIQGVNPVLSPDGTYVATTWQQTLRISDVATQRDVTPAARDYQTLLLTQWIDDTTYAAVGTTGDNIFIGPVDSLVCSVTDDSCLVQNAQIGPLDRLVFPVGGSITDR